MIASIRLWLRKLSASGGQALPVAMGALALGTILITPLLSGASTDSKATGLVGTRAKERYSMDAGIEWSGWRLISNPRLTTDPVYNSAPLAPFPSTIDGAAFPTTQIRYVPAAGAVEGQSPTWTIGGSDVCYAFSASDAGTLSVKVTATMAQMWLAVLPSGASCTRPAGLAALTDSGSFKSDFTLAAAGNYQLLVGVSSGVAGTIAMSVPAATYEVRSTVGARNVTARLIAGYNGLKVASWQLN
jgi:hypothetical protein